MRNFGKCPILKMVIVLWLVGILSGCSNPKPETMEAERVETEISETSQLPEEHYIEESETENVVCQINETERENYKIDDSVLIEDVLFEQGEYQEVIIGVAYEGEGLDKAFPHGLKIQVSDVDFLTLTDYYSSFIIHTYLKEGMHEIYLYNDDKLLDKEELTVRKTGSGSDSQNAAFMIELYQKGPALQKVDIDYIIPINEAYLGSYMDWNLYPPSYKYAEDKEDMRGIRYYIPLEYTSVEKLGKDYLEYEMDNYGMGSFISVQAVQTDFSGEDSEELLKAYIQDKDIDIEDAYDLKSFNVLSCPGIRCLFDISDYADESKSEASQQIRKLDDDIRLYKEMGIITEKDIREFRENMTDDQISAAIDNELKIQGMNLHNGRTSAIFLMKDQVIYSIIAYIPSLSDQAQDAVCNEIIKSFEEYTISERELLESLQNVYYCQDAIQKKMDVKTMPDAINIGCLYENGEMEWVYFHLLKETEKSYIIAADITVEGIKQLAVDKNDFSQIKAIGPNRIDSDKDISVIDVYSILDRKIAETSDYGVDLSEEWIFEDSDRRYITENEILSLTQDEIKIAVNEIYARKGRIFENPDLKEYFESKSWYFGSIPANEFDDTDFNQFEKKNVEILSKYRQ